MEDKIITQEDDYELVEQKPTDKVEPKFKVGDWVVYEENIYQIHNISLKKYYECLRTDGTVHTFDFEYIDSKSSLWTIQDAKDGDVLAVTMYPEGTWIGIFKEQDGCAFSSHCFVNTNGIFKQGTYSHGNKAIHPATKEQRDTLERAMTNAGYKWNKEERKLEKI